MVAKSLAPAKLQHLQFGTEWSELLQLQELTQRDLNRDPWICQYRHLRDLGIQVCNNRPQGSFAQNNPWRDSEGLLDV
jgi:hypothetical protein